MKTIRLVLKDRMTATATAVLVAYLLILQGLVGAMAQGSMAASAIDPLHVICSASGDATIDLPADQHGPAKMAVDCPCCALCRLASTSVPVILDGVEACIPAPAKTVLVPSSRSEVMFSFFPRRLIAEPRAPPIFS
ncbi:DUF2946 domain-containing protein [Phyllobacterium salinisoli]|uniref:DUF2946 domain-containing protein n=2 Tax=Phyllobacterium salinisoli TaxID=1899321 RepID=A0A368K0N8_9HYPH|nr:DUF2946 domain-containing protein [Phyllobacterium salinisoli]